MTTFTDLVVIEAENDPGLVVTRALTANGARINLSTVSPRHDRNWNITATGEAANKASASREASTHIRCFR